MKSPLQVTLLSAALALAITLPIAAQQKVSERTSLAAAALAPATDILPIVDISAGLSGSKKITIDALFTGWGFTAAGEALAKAEDAEEQRTALGLGTAATTAASDYEPALGNPGTNGYILSSTTAGVRSWIAPGSGGGGTVASQAEAETGTDNAKMMTPLRTHQALNYFGLFTDGSGIAQFDNGLNSTAVAATSIFSNNLTVSEDTSLTGDITFAFPGSAAGDIYFRNGSGVLEKLSIGTSGQVLKVEAGYPAWGTGGGGGDLLSTNNLSDLANTGTARTNLGVAIGTNVQAYDADLTTWAGITPSADIQGLLGSANYAAARTNLGLGTAATENAANFVNTAFSQTIAGSKTFTDYATFSYGAAFDDEATFNQPAYFNSSTILGTGGDIIFDLGSSATGDIYYRGAGGPLARLGIGSTGQVLTVAGGLPSWGAAPAALTNFTESINTSTPNATVPAVQLLATNAATNVDVVLTPKGTGALLAQVPDNTATGGNKRGTGAVDWQTARATNTLVASGAYSVIGGGSQNRALGQNSVVAGGLTGSATASYSFVGGGQNNTASSQHTSIVGGQSNAASGTGSAVGGGQSNAAAGTNDTVAGGTGNTTASGNFGQTVGGGYSNQSNANYSAVIGGLSNIASSTYSVVLGGNSNAASGAGSVSSGQFSTTRGLTGMISHASGRFSTTGDAQAGLYVARRSTTDATLTELSLDGSTPAAATRIVLPNNSTYSFTGLLTARSSGGDSAAWRFSGTIERGAAAANTALIGTPTITDTNSEAGAAAWTISVNADTTNGALRIQVTGAAATNIRWVATVETAEVVY